MNEFDVIVVGGGPAGMMAAGHAAEYGRRVLLLEKNRTTGEKLRLTGGGRCNITNAEFDTRLFLANFGEAAKFLFSPFSRFSVRDTFEFFEGRGLSLMVEDRNRAFPTTEKSEDVIRLMEEYMAEGEVTVRFGSNVTGLLMEEGRICGVQTSQGPIRSESVVLATGGLSYKETGSTGDGFRWLREIGHTVAEATPDVVPLRVREQWVKDLSGLTLDPMRITFSGIDGGKVVREGKLLFTHFGVSGPLILNCAHEVKKLLKQGPVNTVIDLFPKQEIPEIDRKVLEIFDENKNKILRNVLRLLAPQGMSRALAAQLSDELLDKKINVVSAMERKQLIQTAKGLPLTVTGTMGYDWAVVCDGGVPLTEVDTRTMASRLQDNLYIVGDLLHISRPSGGFSLQLCWTSGFVAGENA
ncbi:MAG: aminoacetone oxidase family FAD-binding enzyme [Pontiellaceae bacterium]|nr:aminoacetone oxidase family FAD-binding enzyme [Pontiellaceae bacterium]MBN2784262.1 aminoacetone oxidase family FAD-binding enzyme [Pontiellaceae bacterium]